MIAHFILFRPLPDLGARDREALLVSLERALTSIPTIRRAQIGRRRTIGRQYEEGVREDYPFMAMLEFDDEADLRAYLDHPAHTELAKRFFQSVEAASIYDFEMTGASGIREALANA